MHRDRLESAVRAVRHRLFAVTLALVAFASVAPEGQPARRAPKLAVIIVVDQMRADFIDRFQSDWSAGLKRLVTQGAWFRNAAYPYLTTVTCSGHATITTGTLPRTHGVIQNEWWDRNAKKQVTCTEDPSVDNVGYLAPGKGGDSAFRLQVPTFADEMRRHRNARVATVAVKDRSAIILAGRSADAVTWLNSTLDNWQTSTAFSKAPVPAIKAFLEANPIEAHFRKRWDRLLPIPRYQGPDDGLGENPPTGWTSTFPHDLNGTGDTADNADFRTQWERSPFTDDYLGRLATTLVERLRLGQHDGTDVLGVSFSGTDLIGHRFGPASHEIQDAYARLDVAIGALLHRLDALVGRDEYVVALSSDHGVTPIAEQLVKAGGDGGRVAVAPIVDSVESRLQAALGPGKYVAVLSGSNMNLYFADGVYDMLRATPSVLDMIIKTIAAAPGVQQVIRTDRLGDAPASADPVVRAAALGFFPGRSGDLIVALKPGWISTNNAASHGSAVADDQRVPILLMGRGIRRGRYDRAVTPADIAPTLAVLCGIDMPKAEGRALAEALTSAGARDRSLPSRLER